MHTNGILTHAAKVFGSGPVQQLFRTTLNKTGAEPKTNEFESTLHTKDHTSTMGEANASTRQDNGHSDVITWGIWSRSQTRTGLEDCGGSLQGTMLKNVHNGLVQMLPKEQQVTAHATYPLFLMCARLNPIHDGVSLKVRHAVHIDTPGHINQTERCAADICVVRILGPGNWRRISMIDTRDTHGIDSFTTCGGDSGYIRYPTTGATMERDIDALMRYALCSSAHSPSIDVPGFQAAARRVIWPTIMDAVQGGMGLGISVDNALAQCQQCLKGMHVSLLHMQLKGGPYALRPHKHSQHPHPRIATSFGMLHCRLGSCLQTI
jgi:hypothetical protein